LYFSALIVKPTDYINIDSKLEQIADTIYIIYDYIQLNLSFYFYSKNCLYIFYV